MGGRDAAEEKSRLLRAVAFHIHKKTPATEALTACFDAEGRSGRHRQWRQAAVILESEGFVPALVSAGLVGDEAAAVLAIVTATGDHRVLSAALGALADYWDQHA
jgi:hypothetical protein